MSSPEHPNQQYEAASAADLAAVINSACRWLDNNGENILDGEMLGVQSGFPVASGIPQSVYTVRLETLEHLLPGVVAELNIQGDIDLVSHPAYYHQEPGQTEPKFFGPMVRFEFVQPPDSPIEREMLTLRDDQNTEQPATQRLTAPREDEYIDMQEVRAAINRPPEAVTPEELANVVSAFECAKLQTIVDHLDAIWHDQEAAGRQ